MKISPVATTGMTLGSVTTGAEAPKTMVEKIRALKMSTNATPGRVEEATAPVVETPPVEEKKAISDVNSDATKVETEENEPLSPQFAALAKQRRALDVREKAIAEREKALEQSPAGDVIEKAKLKTDPLGVLLDAGVTYDQLTEAVLASQNGFNPEIQALKAEIKALKEGVDKTLTDRDAKAEQDALAEMRREAVTLSSQGDEFELVRAKNAVPTVMNLIERTYRETGEVLDVREALREVENVLLEDGLKLANLKKVQSKIAPQPVPEPQLQRPVRTLTNRDGASIPLSRKARALAAFNGTLNK